MHSLDGITGGELFAAYVAEGYTSTYPDVAFDEYIRAGADVTVRQMAGRCLAAPDMLVSVLTVLALSDDPNILAQSPNTGPLGSRLTKNIPAGPPADTPVLLGQGGADTLVDPDMQLLYAAKTCAAGGDVDYRDYAGYGHVDLAEQHSPAIADALAWTADRLAGKAAPRACDQG